MLQIDRTKYFITIWLRQVEVNTLSPKVWLHVMLNETRIGFHGMAARLARTQLLAGIEFSEAREEIDLNIGQLEIGLV